MSEPLGRDRLGRLVYEGDIYISIFGELEIAFDEGWYGSEVVDLSASPKRSNYERYFADLGTLEEIGEAINADCNSYIEEASAFWVDFAERFHPEGVGDWLQQEATV